MRVDRIGNIQRYERINIHIICKIRKEYNDTFSYEKTNFLNDDDMEVERKAI